MGRVGVVRGGNGARGWAEMPIAFSSRVSGGVRLPAGRKARWIYGQPLPVEVAQPPSRAGSPRLVRCRDAAPVRAVSPRSMSIGVAGRLHRNEGLSWVYRSNGNGCRGPGRRRGVTSPVSDVPVRARLLVFGFSGSRSGVSSCRPVRSPGSAASDARTGVHARSAPVPA